MVASMPNIGTLTENLSRRLELWFRGQIHVEQREPLEATDPASTTADAVASLYPMGENHPLSAVIGAFADEPLWDDWMAAIQEYRQQVTAAELRELGE